MWFLLLGTLLERCLLEAYLVVTSPRSLAIYRLLNTYTDVLLPHLLLIWSKLPIWQKRCLNLFIWYSDSVALPIIVALCVQIFTLHWALLVQIFLCTFGKDKSCPWLVLFHFPKYGVASDFWNVLCTRFWFREVVAFTYFVVDTCFCGDPFACFFDEQMWVYQP